MNHEWYMISTVSGKEEQVVESLKHKVMTSDMAEYFGEFKIFWIPAISPAELIKKAQGAPYKISHPLHQMSAWPDL